MQYRKLGNSDLLASAIGFGAWGIGGITAGATSYGPVSEKDAIATVDAAVDRGINLFDTANVYGDGRSEKVLGVALKAKRTEVLISSKVGLVDYNQKLDLNNEQIIRSVDGSLRRLGTDYLDILHLHKVSLEQLKSNDEILKTLAVLKREGKIRCSAISLEHPDDAIDDIIKNNFPIIQFNLNLLDMRLISNGFISTKNNRKSCLLVRTPFHLGFLANNYQQTVSFAKHDHRSRWSRSQIRRWVIAANKMLNAAGIKNLENTQERVVLALRFCLTHATVGCVLPGMMSVKEVELNTSEDCFIPMSDDQLNAIYDQYTNWNS